MSIDLENYIKEARARGMSDDAMRSALLSAGWDALEISNALQGKTPFSVPSAPTPPPWQKAEPRPVAAVSAGKIETLIKPVAEKSFPYKKIFLIAILGLILAGGGTALSYVYFTTRPPDPHKTIDTAWDNFSNIKTFSYSGSIEGHAQSGSQNAPVNLSNTPFSFTFSGASDIADIHTFKGTTSLDAILGVQAAPQGEISADIIFDSPSAFYIKANTIKFGLANFTKFTGQWIKIPLSTSSAALGAGMLGQNINADKAQVSSEQMQKIKQAALHSGIWQYAATLPNEDVSGIPSYHYSLAFDKDAFGRFLKTTYATMHNGQEPDKNEFDAINKSSDFFSSSVMQVWVGKKDLLPHKFSLALAVASSSQNPVAADAVFTETLKDFDKPIMIMPPQDTKDIKEILGAFFAPVMPSSTINIATTSIDASTWKTYRNEKYGFEVKNAPGWKVEIMPSYDDKGKVKSLQSEFWFTDPGLYRLLVLPMGGGFEFASTTLLKTENIDFNGVSARRRDFGDTSHVFGVVIAQFRNNSTFKISFVPINAREYIEPEKLSEFNQILSTFKFTSPPNIKR